MLEPVSEASQFANRIAVPFLDIKVRKYQIGQNKCRATMQEMQACYRVTIFIGFDVV